MNSTQDTIYLLKRILSGDMPSLNEISAPESTEEDLEKLALQLAFQTVEAHYFINELASGNISYAAPRGNLLLSSSKELQSILRNILYCFKRVSLGDYSQTVDFMGDFSDAFNLYINQVSLREAAQKELAQLERERLEEQNHILSQQLDKQLQYYTHLAEMQDKVRGIRHDIKNHCLALNGLLNNGKIEEAKEYIRSVTGEMLNTDEIMYRTGNLIFDAMLTEKSIRAKKSQIEMMISLALPENLSISNEDWCVLLGNTLDNAIEACEKLEEKRKIIFFEARHFKSMLNITIRNTALPPIQREDGLFHTSKQDTEKHGIGLNNVRRTVDKYAGVLQTKYSDGWFTLTMLLCNLEKK
ncbi:MAG: sensor histidine kinase [Lachnospiraceae bacterium]